MEKIVTTSLRLPEALLVKLKHMAVDNRRSFNSEVLIILQGALEKKEKQGHANAAA